MPDSERKDFGQSEPQKPEQTKDERVWRLRLASQRDDGERFVFALKDDARIGVFHPRG